jgi:L-amino acid N-acyltransferase YncA
MYLEAGSYANAGVAPIQSTISTTPSTFPPGNRYARSVTEEGQMRPLEIRPATPADLPRILQMSAIKREQYERYQPVFHRRARNAASAQEPYLIRLIERDDVVSLVAKRGGVVVGFGTAEIHIAPRVYDPGGPAAMLDDFIVATPRLWSTIGRQLLDALTTELRNRGVVVIIAVCGHRDEPKRRMLRRAGLTIASEWYVQGLE